MMDDATRLALAAADAAASLTGEKKPTEQPVRDGNEAFYTGERIVLTPEQAKARRRRGQWIALGLFAFVILVFVLTMTKMGANILVRDL